MKTLQMSNLKKIGLDILKPYSAILFLDNKIAGFIIVLITLINPSVAISGIFAVFATIGFGKLIEIPQSDLYQGFYIYNSLLVGMGVGYIFSPSITSFVLICVSASFSFIFSFMLNRLMAHYKLPILSLPFSIVTMFFYLASLKYSVLLSSLVNNATIYDIALPLTVSGLFKSFGTIFFLPNNIAGFLLLMLVLYHSRILFITAVSGFYFGVYFHSFLIGSYEISLQNPYAFNYILVSMALCGIFLLPTIKNFLLSLIGVSISVVLTDAITILFHYYAIPVFTIPFNLTVLAFIFVLSVTYYKAFNYDIKATPEESLSNYLSTIFRFGTTNTKISLPFSGEWTVYQGFDDEWTHKGRYRYAYDFVKKKDGNTYRYDGNYIEDYYCYGESILSPVDGYIVDCRHDLIDNAIGDVDRVNNWGNYIIIKSNAGFFVEISHLMQYSLSAKIGDYIKTNDPIAKCGNSGYSPQPHIHIQVQDVAQIGGFTREFCFRVYYNKSRLFFNDHPQKAVTINAVTIDKSISSRLLFVLDDLLKYEVYSENQKIGITNFVVKMDTFGAFYFEDDHRNRLYFYNDTTEFYFYSYRGKESYLKYLFILAPRIPFVNRDGIEYSDYLPLNLLKSRFKTSLLEFLSSFKQEYAKIERSYTYSCNSISSLEGEVKLDPSYKGFSLISYKNIVLKRIEI